MDFQAAQEQMITQQVRPWNVLNERVLHSLRSVPRASFVPAAYRNLAFADTNLPLAHGQVILAPNLAGKILEAMAVQATEQVLLVGAGGGYLAACLGQLAGKVQVLEFYPDLAQQAQQHLLHTTSNNISIEVGDATQLNVEQAFDVVILSGSLPRDDPRYQRALKVGGRLFMVLGRDLPMEALRITRTGMQSWQRDSLFETELPTLPNASIPPAFTF